MKLTKCCTEEIDVRPVKGGTWVLCPPEDRNPGMASLISFDTRQKWKAYYFRFADIRGWVLTRPGLYLRMPEEDFKTFFGDFRVTETEVLYPLIKETVK